jgi:hypothetical protein
MKWTKIASKLYDAIITNDKQAEQKLYAIMDEKKIKKQARKAALKDDKQHNVTNHVHIM